MVTVSDYPMVEDADRFNPRSPNSSSLRSEDPCPPKLSSKAPAREATVLDSDIKHCVARRKKLLYLEVGSVHFPDPLSSTQEASICNSE